LSTPCWTGTGSGRFGKMPGEMSRFSDRLYATQMTRGGLALGVARMRVLFIRILMALCSAIVHTPGTELGGKTALRAAGDLSNT
jgi:hypothetical protein